VKLGCGRGNAQTDHKREYRRWRKYLLLFSYSHGSEYSESLNTFYPGMEMHDRLDLCATDESSDHIPHQNNHGSHMLAYGQDQPLQYSNSPTTRDRYSPIDLVQRPEKGYEFQAASYPIEQDFTYTELN